MNKEEIVNAWATIRRENNTIPDDVLNFMKDSSIKVIESGSLIQKAKQFELEQQYKMSDTEYFTDHEVGVLRGIKRIVDLIKRHYE